MSISTTNLDLPESAFETLPAGGSATTTITIAANYNLSRGGDVTIVAEGAFSYAELDATTISGSIPFLSNTITTSIRSTHTAKAHHNRRQTLARRTIVNSDCKGSELKAVKTALKSCAAMAKTAAKNVDNRDKMIKYFK